ncbi:MAG TPA: hypothetical protein VLA98_08430, partial [Solirubrobacteraceae bacterium]|nr:hypothetical protein [Solirubrobacteraceae bacterium]
MLVDRLQAEPTGDGRVRRSLRMRFDDGEEHACSVTVPEAFAPPDADDASGPLPLALLLAMDRGEDLVVEGRACPRLLARVDRIRELYRAYEPALHPAAVRVAGALAAPAGEGARRTLCCFSRGVDSLYAAADGRSRDGRIDALLYADRFEPVHGAATRAAELALAERAAELLALPLVVVDADIRAPVDGRRDWEDAVGAGLAWLGHALAGGAERLVVPPSDTIWRLGPSGSNPVLDAHFATAALELEHADLVPSRVDKVAFLARERPELLALLKVCFTEDRTDNCG